VRRFAAAHRAALTVISAAAVLDVLLGVAFGFAGHVSTWDGLYFATTTSTTVGYGDIAPHGWLPHLIAVALMIIAIPLFGASFSLFTAGLAAAKVRLRLRDTEKNIKAHLEERLEHHHRELLRHLTAPRPEA
jgi:voltage-gated potassium channel